MFHAGATLILPPSVDSFHHSFCEAFSSQPLEPMEGCSSQGWGSHLDETASWWGERQHPHLCGVRSVLGELCLPPCSAAPSHRSPPRSRPPPWDPSPLLPHMSHEYLRLIPSGIHLWGFFSFPVSASAPGASTRQCPEDWQVAVPQNERFWKQRVTENWRMELKCLAACSCSCC